MVYLLCIFYLIHFAPCRLPPNWRLSCACPAEERIKIKRTQHTHGLAANFDKAILAKKIAVQRILWKNLSWNMLWKNPNQVWPEEFSGLGCLVPGIIWIPRSWYFSGHGEARLEVGWPLGSRSPSTIPNFYILNFKTVLIMTAVDLLVTVGRCQASSPTFSLLGMRGQEPNLV